MGFNVGDVEGFIEGISVDKRCEIVSKFNFSL